MVEQLGHGPKPFIAPLGEDVISSGDVQKTTTSVPPISGIPKGARR